MRRITNTVIMSGLSVALVGGLSACGMHRNSNWPPKFAETRTITLDVPAGALDVEATTGFGDIDVQPTGEPIRVRMTTPDRMETVAGTSTRGIQVVAVVRSDREDRLADVRVLPTLAGSTLSLKAEWPGQRRDSEGIDWYVRTPTVGAVTATTGYGDVVVTSPGGRVDVGTGFGDVTIRNAHAPLDLESGFGDILVDGGRDWVHATTDFGDVSLSNMHAAVRAHSDHGDIDIALSAGNAGPVDSETDFGDVTLIVGPAFTGRLVMATDFGDMNLETNGAEVDLESISDDKMTLAFGSVSSQPALDSSTRSRAITDHGDVRVERRAD